MNKEQQIAEYLEKAKEAEDQAIRTKDPQGKESWLKIAGQLPGTGWPKAHLNFRIAAKYGRPARRVLVE